MAKFYGGASRSTTTKAKKIVRDEMLSYFHPREYGVKTRLAAMKKDADAYNGGHGVKRGVSDYEKGAALVDAACCAVYDQDRMLGKIYGKDKVKTWDMKKRHEVYRHLVGREYSAMLEEKKKEEARRRFSLNSKK